MVSWCSNYIILVTNFNNNTSMFDVESWDNVHELFTVMPLIQVGTLIV